MQATSVDATANMEVADIIDKKNQVFIDANKARLANLGQYSTEALEWLMMEHYQFSFANVHFLTDASEKTAAFDTDAVANELVRNCAEENGHAAMYRAALKKVDCDVEQREDFAPTTHFLATIDKLSNGEPSAVLGTMFATETAAIFEHEVFRDISKEVIKRRNWGAVGDDLVWFHDMHLGGVEQSHREELGVFLRGITPAQGIAAKDGERPTIDTQKALAGAEKAIETMKVWWIDLLAEATAISQSRARAVA
ncbi:hypothetical protein VSS37_17325 [Candidatus Thiothrix sp. Deng01]|uniref:Uncharacterized protein n=1 Tax=Candidatus Thiothrix phosphatis TaxID=3112415 RepID=A0ABU6D101_9GAMM|nr:hypothetical protein [Candidatus Thiothrix sp. Deng01]MEB4592749.1 hypothetical protein [Candidatus Thiothrix sp. Deng01]